jgi:hypothetical protein
MKVRRSWLVALGAAILAVPAAAVADPGHGHGQGQGHGHGQGSTHPGQYVFKGTYGGAGLVNVVRGNGRVQRAGLVGTPVQFDLTSAKLDVADVDGSGVVDASDVQLDDRVVVQAKLPKSDPGTQPFVANHLIDQTNPAADDGDSGGDTGDTGDGV